MDRYPSEIGDEMSEIENDAWVEAVARAICEAEGGCLCLGTEMPCEDRMIQACVAIHVLAPLIIERCAEVAGKHTPKDDEWNDSSSSGCRAFLEGCKFTAENTSKAIRALIQKEASHAEV